MKQTFFSNFKKTNFMKQIRIAFKQFSDLRLRKKGELIYGSLDGNLIYAALAALLATVKVVLDRYIADLAAAATNDRDAVAQKRKSRTELVELLKQLGLAVMAEAKGDEAALISSGFTLVKERETRYITNPGNVTLTQGVSTGMLVCMVKPITGAKSYVHQIATELPTEDSMWTSVTSSNSKYVFEKLTPGKQYWVRVAVIGSRNQIAYSNVATWFAQ
jgi:hypothetical protein